MIKAREIQLNAKKVGVRDQQIEKDYILSWILFGVSRHKQLSKAIVFKGGTVLKKVYFKDYRFSEDLDFTMLDVGLSNEQVVLMFKDVFEWIKEEANILLEFASIGEQSSKLGQEAGGIHFYISYIGPLGGRGNNRKVKVDISKSEQLVFEPKVNDLFLTYSDIVEHQLLCYQLEEVLVEKIRSVMQRMQARDLYDIWFLLEVHEMKVENYLTEIEHKCKSKGLMASNFHKKLEERLPQYKGRWEHSLCEQIKDLPEFLQVERQVSRHLKKLKF